MYFSSMGIIFNRHDQKERRHDLRSHATKAEQILWQGLKTRSCAGVKFRRQHGIGPFIVDFYCPKHKLVIEVDGSSHAHTQQYDNNRQMQIEALGLQIMRFTNEEVIENPDRVIECIERIILGGANPPKVPELRTPTTP